MKATNTMKRAAAVRNQVADMAAQIAALERMTTGELATRYAEIFGETTRSRNKSYLKKKVAYRIQEIAEGGLSARAKSRIEELAEDAPIRHRQRRVAEPASENAAPHGSNPGQGRDPRLPPVGEVLVKVHRGTEHQVLMLEDGFEYQGERYTSLSKIAKEITGTNWNGFLFFGLTQRKRAPRVAR
jgi:hypothetical protein